MKGRVLVVDDSKDIAKLVLSVVSEAGYSCEHAKNADAAFAKLQQESYDLMLLDVEMGGISGLKLLEMIRKEPRTANLPVILLTVLSSETHKVRGLAAGADDYLVKPFSSKELVARIEALLRRTRRVESPDQILSGGGVSVDLGRREAAVKGERVKLTVIEFNLLALLLSRKGYVLSYQALSDNLSEGAKVMTSETLYAHVKNLRRSLGEAGERIETVHGLGYKFVDA